MRPLPASRRSSSGRSSDDPANAALLGELAETAMSYYRGFIRSQRDDPEFRAELAAPPSRSPGWSSPGRTCGPTRPDGPPSGRVGSATSCSARAGAARPYGAARRGRAVPRPDRLPAAGPARRRGLPRAVGGALVGPAPRGPGPGGRPRRLDRQRPEARPGPQASGPGRGGPPRLRRRRSNLGTILEVTPGAATALERLAAVCFCIAEQGRSVGRLEEARDAALRSRDLWGRLAGVAPEFDRPRIEAGRAKASFVLGAIRDDLGRPRPALDAYREAAGALPGSSGPGPGR